MYFLGLVSPLRNYMVNEAEISNGISELEKLCAKSTNIQTDILEQTAKTVDDFSRYLLLTTNGFPSKIKMPILPKHSALASIDINHDLFATRDMYHFHILYKISIGALA